MAASLASKKMRLTIEQRLKKNSSLLPSVTANNFGTFFWRAGETLISQGKQIVSIFSVTDFQKLEKPWKIKWAYCSNGHDQPMDAIYKKVPSLEKKTPVTNLGCEGT